MKLLCSPHFVLAVSICMLTSCGAGTDVPRKDLAPTRIGVIENDHIKESSGIIASRQHPDVFWTLNDHGSAPVVYAMTRDGKSLADFRLPVDNRDGDWEDISTDDQGHLYIASIGNNEGKRTHIEVIRIDEPDPTKAKDKHHLLHAKDIQTRQLTYPDGIFDAESLFIDQGYGYIISKVRHNLPATMYRFRLTKQAKPATLEKVTDLPIFTPVTAANCSPDGKYLAVLSWGGLHVFKVNGNIASAANVGPARIPLVRLQFEGCSFTPDGIILTAESREIFFVPAAAYQ